MEMVKNLREQVAWCQRRHPVTHYYDCAGIVEKYLKLVKVGRRAFPFFCVANLNAGWCVVWSGCGCLCLVWVGGGCCVGSLGRGLARGDVGTPPPLPTHSRKSFTYHISIPTPRGQDPLRGVRVPGAAGSDDE